jgi:hypothetical protein
MSGVLYFVGSRVRVTATFTHLGGLTDPTAPDKTVTTYTYGIDGAVLRGGLGIFTCDITLDRAGVWDVRPYGTGTVTAAGHELLTVLP